MELVMNSFHVLTGTNIVNKAVYTAQSHKSYFHIKH